MITKRIEKFYSKNLNLIFEDSIESILYNQKEDEKDEKEIIKIILKSGKEIKTNLIIQAIGVHSNNELAKNSNLKIGNKGGILVNEKFECFSNEDNTKLDSIFSKNKNLFF